MNHILAGQDLLAADLPEIEPTEADMLAIEALDHLSLVEERIDAELTELATYGAVDELANRRFRRTVRAELDALDTAATALGVSA